MNFSFMAFAHICRIFTNLNCFDFVKKSLYPEFRNIMSEKIALRTIIIVALFGFLWVGFSLLTLYVYGKTNYLAAINSDLIQPFLVLHGAFRDPESLLHWVYPRGMFVFPDWVLTSLVLSTPLSKALMPVAYAGSVFLGYASAFGYILYASGRSNLLSGVMIGTGLFAAMLLLSLTDAYSPGAQMTLATGSPEMHSGAILVGLLTIGIVVSQSASPLRRKRVWSEGTIVLCFLAFACGYSDLLYIMWFVAPIVVAAAFLNVFVAPRMVSWTPCISTAVFAIAGALVDRFSRPAPPEVGSDYATSFHVWWQTLVGEAGNGGWQFPLAAVISLVMVVRAITILVGSRRRKQIPVSEIAELLLIACMWAALLFPLATGAFSDPALLRYSLPIFILPYVWIAVCGFGLISSIEVGRGEFVISSTVSFSCIGWFLIATLIFPRAFAESTKFTRSDPLADCLMANGLTEGYGDYWSAKYLMWKTDMKVHIAQITNAPDPYYFDYNDQWFHQHVGTGKPLEPNFILTKGLDPQNFEAKFGRPDRHLTCDGQDVWVYNHKLPLF